MAAKTVAAFGFDLSFFLNSDFCHSLSRAWHDDQAREICFKHSKIKGGTLLNTIRVTAFLHNLNEHSRKTRMKLGLSYTLDLRSDSISVECRMVNSRTAA